MKFIQKTFQGMMVAFKRFPLAITSLISETILLYYIISLDKDPSTFYLKIVFIFLVLIVEGISVEFLIERFNRSLKFKQFAYLGALALVTIYAFIIWPSPEIDYLVGTRTVVALFALTCAGLYIPSYKNAFEFNLVALTAFKAMFTSVLYAFVLFLGLFATIASIDILLFNVDEKMYAYTAVTVWGLFMVTYFLSLLPDFNSQEESDVEKRNEIINFPKILLILISYIAVPLVGIYSLVLIAYIVKIIVTFVWPIGQLGPMVLAYSIAGLVVYILASNLKNAFAKAYQRFFPMIWIPVVITQLISITIRLAAYGITESRYYLALFGLYSLGMGIYLVFKPVVNNQKIALIAMIVALVSIVPPVDAFTISRWSQKTRLTQILEEANLLVNGEIKPNADVSLEVRKETTSIMEYMDRRHYLADLSYLPSDFSLYDDFETTFGFQMSYTYYNQEIYYNAWLDTEEVLSITGYDSFARLSIHPDMKLLYDDEKWELNNLTVHIEVEQIDTLNHVIKLIDETNNVLIETESLYTYASLVKEKETANHDMMSADSMSFIVENEVYKLKIIFQNIYLNSDTADYEVIVLVGVK